MFSKRFGDVFPGGGGGSSRSQEFRHSKKLVCGRLLWPQTIDRPRQGIRHRGLFLNPGLSFKTRVIPHAAPEILVRGVSPAASRRSVGVPPQPKDAWQPWAGRQTGSSWQAWRDLGGHGEGRNARRAARAEQHRVGGTSLPTSWASNGENRSATTFEQFSKQRLRFNFCERAVWDIEGFDLRLLVASHVFFRLALRLKRN